MYNCDYKNNIPELSGLNNQTYIELRKTALGMSMCEFDKLFGIESCDEEDYKTYLVDESYFCDVFRDLIHEARKHFDEYDEDELVISYMQAVLQNNEVYGDMGEFVYESGYAEKCAEEEAEYRDYIHMVSIESRNW